MTTLNKKDAFLVVILIKIFVFPITFLAIISEYLLTPTNLILFLLHHLHKNF